MMVACVRMEFFNTKAFVCVLDCGVLSDAVCFVFCDVCVFVRD